MNYLKMRIRKSNAGRKPIPLDEKVVNAGIWVKRKNLPGIKQRLRKAAKIIEHEYNRLKHE